MPPTRSTAWRWRPVTGAMQWLAAALLLVAPGCQLEPSAAPAADAVPGQPATAKTRPAASRPPAVSAGPRYRMTAERAARFAALTLECQDRPYPNKPSHVYDSPASIRPPQELTPSFYGCFDWHSAVHGHWTLVRLLRRFPAMPGAERMRAALRKNLARDALARERAFFGEERNRLFERPYGWAWLMRLAAELAGWRDDDGARFARNLAPLVALLREQMLSYLSRLSVPVRAGTHNNTAFAMLHVLDYARAVDDRELERALVQRAREFFLADRACPTDYEPSGEDFISPCLTQADLMRRVLPQGEFSRWLTGFLPPMGSPRFAPLRRPTEVRDRHDPRIGHLIGLALQRAWSFEGIAAAVPADDARGPKLRALARLHRDHGLSQMFDSGYGGSHWLASFAVYLLTATS